MHSLLSSGLGLPPAFSSAALGLASRLPGLVRFMNSSIEKISAKSYFYILTHLPTLQTFNTIIETLINCCL